HEKRLPALHCSFVSFLHPLQERLDAGVLAPETGTMSRTEPMAHPTPLPAASRAAQPAPGSTDVIARIKDHYASLSPAEQAVADAVPADVRATVEDSNAAIAGRAGVSERTVTRFCRSIACAGVRDFKLQLAGSLVVGEIYLA